MADEPLADSISVRMYNVGFGDCFLITIRRSGNIWRMLVDCGVHSQGQNNSLHVIVPAVIADITSHGRAYIDIVVATHHHADHIAGFGLDYWDQVEVGEVWLPFVEDRSDPDAILLRESHKRVAGRLVEIIGRLTRNIHLDNWPPSLRQAQHFALNSFRNADATDRLLGRAGKGFKNEHHEVRYFPALNTDSSVIPIPGMDGKIHVLGPSRSPEAIRKMNPPKSAGWFQLDSDATISAEYPMPEKHVFDTRFNVSTRNMPAHLRKGMSNMKQNNMFGGNDSVLQASTLLERSVNNTSIVLLLEIAGVKLFFPGDAQHGGWQHVLAKEGNRSLLSDVDFYKIGHHGSHNGTAREYIDQIWETGGTAFLPWGLVKAWSKIPKPELIEALERNNHKVVRGWSESTDSNDLQRHPEGLWVEKTFPFPQ